MLLFRLILSLLFFASINLSHAAYPQNLLMKDDCLFAYLGEPIGSYRVTFLDGSETQMNTLTELTYDSKSYCARNDTPGFLAMSFKPDDNFDEIKLEFTIKLMPSDGVWEITKTQFKIKARNQHLNPADVIDLEPTSGVIYANSYQSYSCSALVLQNLTPSKDGPQYKITLRRFQVQPFMNPDARYIFAKSHDCSTWLTLPQIMGFLLVLFIIFTSLIGVYLLLELGNHTSDLKYNKLGGLLMNQAQLDATKAD